MSQIDLEDLLWQLADSRPDRRSDRRSEVLGDDHEEQEQPDLPDAVLAAYREDRLDEPRRRQVEELLATHPADRRRLVELTDLSPPAGLKSVRRRVLQDGVMPVHRPHWPGRLGWLAAAALVVGALGLGLWIATPSLPPLPEIHAHIDGLAVVRNGGEEPTASQQATTATPDATVTVGIHVDPARAGVEVALYRHDTETGILHRLPVPATWRDRSTALFRAPARELVGERPGSHRLFAVAAWENHLPSPRPLAPQEAPLEALTGPFIDVSSLTLEIVRDPPPDPADASLPSSDPPEKEAESP